MAIGAVVVKLVANLQALLDAQEAPAQEVRKQTVCP